MTVTFQFLIAQHLQDHGTKNILTLAKKFDTSRNVMGATLNAMKQRDYVKSDGSKPGNWSLLKMPRPRGFTTSEERQEKKRKSADRNGGHLNFIATLPLKRGLAL